MPNFLEINSHKGNYRAEFILDISELVELVSQPRNFFLIDSNIALIYQKNFHKIIQSEASILVDATEHSKSLKAIEDIIVALLGLGIKRGDTLVGVGGGVMQDITCFISSLLFRGLDWIYLPTTLLAQADSCIGSKSSVNLENAKNILGTFNPPKHIYICTNFLKSLHERELRSGLGEILKVHAIDSIAQFNALAADYDRLLDNEVLLLSYIKNSLLIKKSYIEIDEFDKGIRNIFNYGHSFGHAIEVSSDYKIPHGIAVTIGMDMANYVAMKMGWISFQNYERMHKIFYKNFSQFIGHDIFYEKLINAISKDKKNTSTALVLILPHDVECTIRKTEVILDQSFKDICKNYLRNFHENKFER